MTGFCPWHRPNDSPELSRGLAKNNLPTVDWYSRGLWNVEVSANTNTQNLMTCITNLQRVEKIRTMQNQTYRPSSKAS